MLSLWTKHQAQLRRVMSELVQAGLLMLSLVVILWFAFDLSAPVNYLASKGMLPQELATNFTVSCGSMGLALWLWFLWSMLWGRAREPVTSDNPLPNAAAEETSGGVARAGANAGRGRDLV